MPELDDIALLKQFADNDSELAFTEIVSRHLNLVYSTALRATGDSHAAQEISQAVFVILARKAKSLGAKTILSGWLYQTTRLTAANHLRTEIRRRNREQEAYMQSTLNESESEAWLQIAPILDDAISKLGARDRNAIVLRFFENKNLGEVGAALGASEDAAKMRVNRALEKIRKFFTKRGIALSTAIIATAVSANSVQAAPLGLAVAISATAVKSSAVAASTLTLVKGALKIMAWTKTKIAIAAGAATLLIAGSTTVAFNVWFFKPSVEDVFKHFDSAAYLKKSPSVTLLRPTQYANQGDWINGDGNRYLGRNRSMSWVLAAAYNIGPERMVLPPDLPTGGFDYLITASGTPRVALQELLKKQFGLVAHAETRTTKVLILKVQKYGAAGLKINPHINDESILIDDDKATLRDFPMSSVADALGGYFVNAPVVDETGLTNRYDLVLHWKGDIHDVDAVSQILQNELGLELVPDQRAIEMLVVEFQDGATDYTPRAGSDLQGYWRGTEMWGGSPWPVALKITEPTDGHFRAQFRNLWFNPQFAAASSVTYNPPKVRVEFPAPARVFEGEIDSEHTEIVGTLKYVNTNANNNGYAMTVKLIDPKEDAALEAQKNYHSNGANDLAGHWTATLNNDEWKLDIAHLSEGKWSASLTPPGWDDGIGDTLFQNVPNVRIEFAYRRMATFIGKLENGKLTGTLQENRKGTPQPITFERSTEK